MIISQTIGLDQAEGHKPTYFGEAMPSPLSLTASVPSVGHNTISGAPQGVYPSTDGYYLPARVQTELSNMNMYSAQPESSVINSPGNYIPNPASVATAPGLMGSHYAAAGLQHPPCYSSLGDEYEMRPAVGGVWHGGYAQPPSSCYPYENGFGHQYPYDRYCGMDINDGVRRKNATRESTNTLKAWLQEHKKNPYPTKGEKIMLAIITKMTLTQVSTWFANARRRLKKENKMTWIPKNRSSDSNNNSSSKKTEDEDDDESQNSQDRESKSDNEQSIDSDDSDVRKVTSTNSNDDITTTTDFKEATDFTPDRCVVSSNGKDHRHQESGEFPSQTHPEGHLVSNFQSFGCKDKSWSTVSDETKAKSAEMLRHQAAEAASPYSNDPYDGPSNAMGQSTSLVTTTIEKGETPRLPVGSKYAAHNWTSGSYHYPSGRVSDDPQMHQKQSAEDLETIHSHSPSQGSEAKSVAPKNNFQIQSDAGSCSTSPIVSSSFIHGYPHQHSNYSQTIDYYRHLEQSHVDPSTSYYPQLNLHSQQDPVKSERISEPYPSNQNQLPLKQTNESSLPPSSLTPADSSYHQHLSPQYYPNIKFLKCATPSSSSYATSFYHYDNINQLHANAASSNLEYYQRKNFFNPAEAYHSPEDSPRK